MSEKSLIERVQEAVDQSRALFDDQLDAFLTGLDIEDPEVAAEVRAMVQAERRKSSRGNAAIQVSTHEEKGLPEQIGQFHIIDRIRENRLGHVLLAEQAQPQRKVALWIAHADLLGEAVVLTPPGLLSLTSRGLAEVYYVDLDQDCPNIASELLTGTSLLNYAQDRSLSREDRIDLAIAFCDALHFAHARGVIHGDLRPEYVSVANDGVPRITGFGLAGMVACAEPDAKDLFEIESIEDDEEARVDGAIAWLAPERFDSNWGTLDIRGDVYAAGLMIDELLSGEAMPGVPTDVYGDLQQILSDSASKSIWLDGRAVAAPGELGDVLRRATEADPDERYPSMSALGSELRRIRDKRATVVDQERSGGVRRAFRRKQPLALLGSVALLGLAGWAGAATVLKYVAEQDALAARAHAAQSESIASFLTRDLLGEANGFAGTDPALSALIDRASGAVGVSNFTPEAEVRVRSVLAESLYSVGRYEGAMEQWRVAAGILADEGAQQSELGLSVATGLGRTLRASGDLAGADAALRTALGSAEQAGIDLTADGLRVRALRADIALDKGEYALGIQQHNEVYEERRKYLGEDHEDTVESCMSLGRAHELNGEPDRASVSYRRAVAGRASVFGELHPLTLEAQDALAHVLGAMDKPSEAAPMHRRVFEARAKLLGPSHPEALRSRLDHAAGQVAIGATSEALAQYEQALLYIERGSEEVQAMLPEVLINWSATLRAGGDASAAVEHAERAAGLLRARFSAESLERAESEIELAWALTQADRRIEADTTLVRAVTAANAADEEGPAVLRIREALVAIRSAPADVVQASVDPPNDGSE